jgi:FkbM family methyltransferase
MDWKRIPREFLFKHHIEIRRGPRLTHFLQSREIDIVLDVGANVGQFAKLLRRQGYKGEIVSFEPIKAVFEQLQLAASADTAWSARNFALGDVAGVATINVSELSVFSSILSLAASAADFDKKSAVVRTEQITVERLDNIFKDYEGRNVFLKIDTQGFEAAVLKGAAESLSKIKGIQLELPAEHLYTDTWNMEDALATMRSYGFLPAQINPVNYITADTVSANEFDCVFRRMVV